MKKKIDNMNRENDVVGSFGFEWNKFNYKGKETDDSLRNAFNVYFSNFNFESLPANPVGFDMGCGAGRWAFFVAPRVFKLYCVDPSSAIFAAKLNLKKFTNCIFINEGVFEVDIESESMDFGYSLGVLHHITHTEQGLSRCVSFLKKGAPFLLYLYYSPTEMGFFKGLLWRGADLIRRIIIRFPYGWRYRLTTMIAVIVYFPLSRLALLMEKLSVPKKYVDLFPLSIYRNYGLFYLLNDSFDRFATSIEKRFTRAQIKKMMEDAGLENIVFNSAAPFWTAVGTKS